MCRRYAIRGAALVACDNARAALGADSAAVRLSRCSLGHVSLAHFPGRAVRQPAVKPSSTVISDPAIPRIFPLTSSSKTSSN